METNPSKKLKDQLEKYNKQLGLALLVIVAYLKMSVVTANENDKSTHFLARSLYIFGYVLSILLYYLKTYKQFFTIIIHEFFSVLILKENPWLSVNEKIS